MRRPASKFLLLALLAASSAFAQDGPPYDADGVVAIIKKNQDVRAVCMSGPSGIRATVTNTVTDLAQKGQIKGNPQQVGEEAGRKLGDQCRGK